MLWIEAAEIVNCTRREGTDSAVADWKVTVQASDPDVLRALKRSEVIVSLEITLNQQLSDCEPVRIRRPFHIENRIYLLETDPSPP